MLFVPWQVAKSSQSEGECQENILAALGAAVERLPRKWAGVKVRRSSALARTNAQHCGLEWLHVGRLRYRGCITTSCPVLRVLALLPMPSLFYEGRRKNARLRC